MRKILSLLFIVAVLAIVPPSHASNENELTLLESCHVTGLSEQVECGFVEVPENYAAPDGKAISIHVVRLPAVAAANEPDPLLFLAGGPGQAATELAGMIASIYSGVRQTRDILLIDQRGTGQSNPFRCENGELDEIYSMLALPARDADIEEEAQSCAAELDADFQQYSTANAVRDFDAVREALGYEQINIYGGSYGTRSGLAYLRDFPDSIRVAVLDGLAPPQMKIGLFGQTSAQAFDRMVADCQSQLPCEEAFGNVRATFDQVSTQLAASPELITLNDPRSYREVDVLIDDMRFQQMMFTALYHPRTRQMLPFVISEAHHGNFKPLVGLAGSFEQEPPLYLGLMLSVACQEDVHRYTDEDRQGEENSSFFGDATAVSFEGMCAGWPVSPASEQVHQPIAVDHKVLLLSGAQDPVTPPAMADLAAETLPNSQHLVAENGGHTIAGHTCANELIDQFLTEPEVEIDDSCLEETKVLPFLLNVNGEGM